MFTVDSIWSAVERAVGTCDPDVILDRISRAVEILCTEAEWDPTVGFVDICVDRDACVTLPDEVEGILAVNIGGSPAQGHDKWFQFHLNGPGSGGCGNSCTYDWMDRGAYPVITDPSEPFKVIAFIERAEDNNVPLRVYGYDYPDNKWVTSVEDGESVDGILVPTVYGVEVPNPEGPKFSRITRVSKGVSLGYIRLSTLDISSGEASGLLLGYYRPYETDPSYRRIRLSQKCTWARVAYKRKFYSIVRRSDLIPLHSSQAVVMMVQALAKFDNDRLEDGQNYWKTAVALLVKKQHSVSPPTGPSIQISDRNLIADKRDRLE